MSAPDDRLTAENGVKVPGCPGCGRGDGLCADCTDDGAFGHQVTPAGKSTSAEGGVPS